MAWLVVAVPAIWGVAFAALALVLHVMAGLSRPFRISHWGRRARTGRWMLALASILCLAFAGTAQALREAKHELKPYSIDPRPSDDPDRVANGLAPTPPMGWNSWNRFGCTVDERIVRAAADRLVASGMRDAGYRYVVVDDCWHGARDANGFIGWDAKRFPSGMPALAAYLHERGLKFGIYSDAGRATCAHRPGSQGHEYQDALSYARWGVDYLKYDWCYNGGRDAEEAYALMADALRATGRPIVFAMCEWGQSKPWEWADKIGNSWRTAADLFDHFPNMLAAVDVNEPLWPHAGPGHWNDPDMLQIGNGGMSAAEYRSMFSLWAMMAAPLMAGNDLTAMDAATRSILLNHEVIAIDQDRLGRQGQRVRRERDVEIWKRQLADGGQAVLLFNRGEAPERIALDWGDLAGDGRGAQVRDLWRHSPVARTAGPYIATVAPHDVVMLRVIHPRAD
jgi:alpha-galactosidase